MSRYTVNYEINQTEKETLKFLDCLVKDLNRDLKYELIKKLKQDLRY